MKLRIIALAFTILVVVSSIAVMEHSNSGVQYGVSVHSLNPGEAAYVKNAGMSWIRIDIGAPGFQYAISNAYDHGLKVLGIVDYYTIQGNFSLQEWNQTVYNTVMNYKNEISTYEIWNEPNTNLPAGNSSAHFYFLMEKYAYEIIKKMQPSAAVVGLGGLNILDGQSALNWLAKEAGYGISKYSDVVSLHLYFGSENNSDQVAAASYLGFISEVRTLIDKPIWVTETGIPTGYGQSNYIRTVYPILVHDGIKHIFWYDLKDDGMGFGLLNFSGQPKASYYEMKAIIEENP